MSAMELDAQKPDTLTFGRAAPMPLSVASLGQNGWSDDNWWEARAVSLRRGQPGHGPHMDRDGDGFACEPYHGM